MKNIKKSIREIIWTVKSKVMVLVYSISLSIAYKYRVSVNYDAKNIIVCLKDKKLKNILLPYTNYEVNKQDLMKEHGIWDYLDPCDEIHNTIAENLACVHELTRFIAEAEEKRFALESALKRKSERAKFKRSLNRIDRTRNRAYNIIRRFER